MTVFETPFLMLLSFIGGACLAAAFFELYFDRLFGGHSSTDSKH